MRTSPSRPLSTLAAILAVSCSIASSAFAQTPPAAAPEAPTVDKPPLKQEELDQLLAPIALYPDSLVSQILMACTYPLEVVEASRWAKQNKLTGDAMGKALEAQTWDASVKSLVNFPQVLEMLNEKLDMTIKIGDAFIGQQKQVLDTVQSLRAKAKAAGNLESNEQQKVEVQQQGATQTIVIQQTNPDVIYVPTYNPTVVYGTWPYPSYPPYYYYPPGYSAGAAAISFGVGVACGLAWGYAWGNCNWGHGDVDIDINQNINRNTNINRNNVNANIKNGQWQHNPSHRQGVPYRNQATARQYGRGTDAQAAQAREQYRGRAEQGRQDINRQGLNQNNIGQGGQRDAQRGGQGASTADRSAGGNRSGGASTRDAGSSAFSGSDRGGQATRDASNRGSSSRGSSANRPSSGSRPSGGGSRGGGGGGRGGGGRR